MAIPNIDYGTTLTSGEMTTSQASIEMTPEMFSILSSGVYSDKIMAVVREIICNARDAQVVCGEDRPVEVHLPNTLEPYFHVRDFGTGISEEGVMDMYLKYGHSTKKSSNDVIGMMGIGSKSPLAYSDSFIVESYFEGVATTYSVYKENGIPQISKLSQGLTTEPSGLKVKLSVAPRHYEEFVSKTQKFLTHFGYPVTLTGARIINRDPLVPVIDNELYTVYNSRPLHSYGGTTQVLMGGVTYSISEVHTNRLRKISSNGEILLKFGIGELSVAASRETLSEDKQTTGKIADRVEKVLAAFNEDIGKQVSLAKTPKLAFDLAKKYGLMNLNGSYRGRDAPVEGTEGVTHQGSSLAALIEDSYKSVTVIDPCGQVRQPFYRQISKEIIALVKDRKVGYVKVAKAIANEDNSFSVCVVEDVEELVKLKAFFGEVKVCSVSSEYAQRFPKKPKEKGKIAVAKSGLFTHTMGVVKELTPETEGYYISFNRDDCTMEGGHHLSLGKVRDFLRVLAAYNVIKEGDIYISRVAGLPAIKKTKLVAMKFSDLLAIAKKGYSSKDLDVFATRLAKPVGGVINSPCAQSLLKTHKEDFPLLAGVAGMDFSANGVSYLGSLNPFSWLRCITTAVDNKRAAFNKEGKQFLKRFSLLEKVSSWRLSDTDTKDLLEFYEFKEAKGLTEAA